MTPKRADIEEFMKVVDGSTEETAQYYIEMCGGNCKEAINLYYELHTHGNNESQTNVAASPGIQNTRQPNIPLPTAIPEEDDDFVRAPDRHFSQALIHDMDAANFLYSSKEAKKKEPALLPTNDSIGKLFAPPHEIICKLTFEQTRKKAKMEDKYVLVNIQNSEFDSMRLNRDIWKNESIQQIINDFFIFWMRHETDQEAMVFMNTYKVTQLPYICALCKRTGRQLKVWTTKQFGDIICAQSQLYEFIETAERTSSTESLKKIIDNETTKSVTSTTASTTRPIVDESRNTSGSSDKRKEKQSIKTVVKTVSKAENKITTNKKEELKIPSKKESKKFEASLKKETTNETKKDIGKVKTAATNAVKPKTAVSDAKPITTVSDVKLKDIPLAQNNKEYNNINNELSELHKLRLERMKKK